jgi:hypothetical protein
MQIATSADALGRATYNALRYPGKTAPWDMALVVVMDKGVSFLTTDSYALSWSLCRAEHAHVLAVNGVSFKITRADMELLEARCRAGKRERVTLDFLLEDREIWYRGEDPEKDLCMSDVFEDGIEPNSWDEINLSMFRDLIAERKEDPSTRQVLLAPKYLQKIGMLKGDKNQGACISIGAPDEPVTVTFGEDFGVIIEPIDIERHKAALGEGAVW